MQLKYKVNMHLDAEGLAVDLVVGGFDLLSGATSSAPARKGKDADPAIFSLKSFLINKIPLLLSQALVPILIAHHISPEHCIERALTHVDSSVFPSVSVGMIKESVLSDVRQQFLFSCVLHSLIRAESVARLLEEQPFTAVPDSSSRYVKDMLVEECTSDSERIGQLVDDLEKLDGNAGAICLAITEVSTDLVNTVKVNNV
jgi:mediator of RNA polymerase II transcription subunit 5